MSLTISDEQVFDLVRERIRVALPPQVLRAISRNILRKQLAEPTIEEAARLLKWKSPVSLGRALKRFGATLTHTHPNLVTVPMTELIRFRNSKRVKSAKRGKSNVVQMEGSRVA